MQDLFCDIEFTLVTSEEAATKATRSSGVRIITPSKIYAVSGNDSTILYDVNDSSTRSYNIDGSYGVNVYDDLSGDTISINNYVYILLEKAICDSGVDFVFEFKFEEEPGSIREFEGKFEGIKAYLDGNLYMDYLVKCIANGKYSEKIGYDEVFCFKEKAIDDLKFKFLVGEVPVWVTISTDLCGLLDVEAEAEATLSSGFYLSATTQLGMEYNATTDVITPFASFSSEFTPYPLTISSFGTLNSKTSMYPKFNVMFYDLVGPSIEPISYIELDLQAGFRASTDGDNYIGWQNKLYSGMKYRLGMSYDFWGLLKDSKYTEVYEAESFYTKLLESPASVKLAEGNKSELNIGETIDVTFETYDYNYIVSDYYVCSSVFVILESDGIVSNEIVMSDEYGLATVSWQPTTMEQTLNARIVNKDGETISSVTYAPEIKAGTHNYLIDFLEYSYPDYDIWTIYDKSATTSDFAGLSAALATVARLTPDREISLVFPELTEIPDFAIFGAETISETYDSSAVVNLIADNATSIGDYSFYKCTSLEIISITSATYIGYYSFFGCTSLTTAYLPVLEDIKFDDAFIDCSNLCNVTFGGSGYSLGSSSGSSSGSGSGSGSGSSSSSSSGSGSGSGGSSGSSYGTSFGSYIGGFSDNSTLTTVEALGTTEIWDYAFYNCISLSFIELSNVIKIGKYAFYNCISLPSFNFPSAVSIGEGAFSKCSAISNADLPLLTALSDSVFEGCSSLESVSLPQTTSIGSSSFADCSSLTTLEIGTGESTITKSSSSLVEVVSIAADAFEGTDTSKIDLTIGALNFSCVSGNTLTIGDFTAQFKSITVSGVSTSIGGFEEGATY